MRQGGNTNVMHAQRRPARASSHRLYRAARRRAGSQRTQRVHHADHHHRLRLSENTRRAQGAPRAAMRLPAWQAHLSRFEIWCSDHESKKQIVSAFGRSPVRNVEGPPGLPVAALQHEDVGFTSFEWRTSAGTRIEHQPGGAKARDADRVHTRGVGTTGRGLLRPFWLIM